MNTPHQYALRLPGSLMNALKKLVAEDGTTINQFINVAVAEKLSALKTADYFEARAKRANKKAFDGVLKRLGNEAPRKGDERP